MVTSLQFRREGLLLFWSARCSRMSPGNSVTRCSRVISAEPFGTLTEHLSLPECHAVGIHGRPIDHQATAFDADFLSPPRYLRG
jgi:hypothetical protein